MPRKLASIQRVKTIEPITGADIIAKATILGWHVVTKKGEFQPGDLVVFCEIDSKMPEKPEFEFLRKVNFVIRTIKLRGQVSQGIAFPSTILPGGTEILEGKDVTAILGINQYEPPIPASMAAEIKGRFPSFIPRTEEARIQTVPDILLRHRGTDFYVTEKVDGASGTFYYLDGQFGICSRNMEVKTSMANIYVIASERLQLEEKLKRYGKNLALQGEVLGPNIQKNKYGLLDLDILFFSVYDLAGHYYLDYGEFVELIHQFGLKTVPIIEDKYQVPQSVDELVQFSDAPSRLNPAIRREGIVVRAKKEITDFEVGRLSFKVINPQFLLKFNE